MSSKHSRIGTCIGGRYRIEALLGQGGMSHVYLAEDEKLKGKKWAVKECLPFEADMTCFMEEAEMLARLGHPQLPQLVDYFTTEDGNGFLVMDYIQGPTLQDLFEEKGRELPIAKIVHIAFQLCDLFHYLHTFQPRPIIYRDLKPSNVMLGEQNQVRLIDFGVARHFKQGKASDTMQIGTIGFAAPEQFLGLQTDARSDLFTLGSVLYYLLSGGQYAYITQKPLEQIRLGLPDALTSTIRLLLQEHPQNRCQTAMEVKMRLRSIYPEPTMPSIAWNQPNTLNPLTPDKLIVVGGLFPGVGATFMAISLARILHAMQIPNALVEHPTVEPDLYMLLYGDSKAPKDYTFGSNLIADRATSAVSTWVNGFTTWVPLHPDGFQGTWHSADSFKLLHRIKKPIVIWDVSTQWDHPSVQELCHSADEIIVVVDASPGKCNRPSSRAILHLLDSYQQRGKMVHYVTNGALPGQFRKEWVNSLPVAPLCTLPEIPRTEVMRAVWKGECIQDQSGVLEPLFEAMVPLLSKILPAHTFRKSSLGTRRSLFSRFKKINQIKL